MKRTLGSLACVMALSLPAEATLSIPDPMSTLASSGSNFAIGPRDLPLGFQFFGQVKTQIYVNSNGSITFGSNGTGSGNTGFSGSEMARIAPFWDYLPVAGGAIRDVTTSGYYAVIWDGVNVGTSYSPARQVTVEAILIGSAGNPWNLAPDTIVFSYGVVGGTYQTVFNGNVIGAGATVGLNQGQTGVNVPGAFVTLGALANSPAIGAADGRLTEEQAMGLSNWSYCFTPTNGAYRAELCNPTLAPGANAPVANPEPSTFVLFGLGAAVLARLRARRVS